MTKILLRYLNLLVLTLLVVIVFSFTLGYLFPGDVYTNLTGLESKAEALRYLKVDSDAGFFSLFIAYFSNTLVGQWGVSSITGEPLFSEVLLSLPATLELGFYALLLAVVVGLPCGFFAGLKPQRSLDMSILGASAVMYSFPVFWLAMVFILIFSLNLEWLPMSGRVDLLLNVPTVSGFIFVDILLADNIDKGHAFVDALKHLALPTLSVSIITMATLIRAVRRSTLDVMRKPYIIAAQSRGLSSAQIFLKHGMRNALLPILPIMAMQVTTLITNVMIVESLFSWPGMGHWLLQAIYQQDYPAIRTGLLAVAGAVIVLTIIIEVLSRLVDPSREKFDRVAV
ncbi:ABC transporter permease subunit [Alteromonas oceanisediminis]|uniref:ABC transporter permease subunit n=1 Tax=Alteromonas oceanisediminis TaxID=2836180 RepID=UPI001BD9919F|nr:ABC transporter permease subunit [Alteromonas oceanisediminis]MBT0584876.1 ABC transporter permease subunit [Alteromonas oceanisediminis]